MIGPDVALPLPWLGDALARGRAQRAHALLIHGPDGVGQFELALALAQAWLCEDDAAPVRPCGRCTGCRQVQARQHPDMRLVVPAALRESLVGADADEVDGDAEPTGAGRSKARPSREIRVDEIRQAIAWTQTTASRGRAKVLVLHPASAMNVVAANALLKTLEEPPGDVRLLLTCGDPELLLPTIRSRCQRLALALPPRDVALDWLAGQGVADAEVLLEAAGGRPQQAVALRDEGFDAARWTRVPKAVAAADASVLAGCSVARAVDVLHKLCHDLMAQAAGAAPRFFPRDALPPGASWPALAAWSKTLVRTARHDEHPWNAPLLVESLVLEGQRCLTPPTRRRGGAATLAAR
ncbi:DNA polymerase III subunit delta' [Azohydromonas sp.]|uniref:DNA polymerase III subunit delta' n=1 Tax=Azohydromonas sp. TaxID=1872666 RepID=UPI002BE8FCE8|nr:DNA polymerase III subunit delta' [Azohydromonas sp.]HMM85973.1 DNA polymerase III subunit delta' [Azohydromonas sp.]